METMFKDFITLQQTQMIQASQARVALDPGPAQPYDPHVPEPGLNNHSRVEGGPATGVTTASQTEISGLDGFSPQQTAMTTQKASKAATVGIAQSDRPTQYTDEFGVLEVDTTGQLR